MCPPQTALQSNYLKAIRPALKSDLLHPALWIMWRCSYSKSKTRREYRAQFNSLDPWMLEVCRWYFCDPKLYIIHKPSNWLKVTRNNHYGFSSSAWGRAWEQDGWVFGRNGSSIPEHYWKEDTQEILRHWLALKANIYIFCERKLRSDYFVPTIQHQSSSPHSAQQIYRALSSIGVKASLGVNAKGIYRVNIFHQDNIRHLFNILGWSSPIYSVNHHIEVMQTRLGGQ